MSRSPLVRSWHFLVKQGQKSREDVDQDPFSIDLYQISMTLKEEIPRRYALKDFKRRKAGRMTGMAVLTYRS